MQVTKIRNESKDITTNLMEFKRLIRKKTTNKYQQIRKSVWNRKIPRSIKLPKLTQETENLNGSVTSKETGPVIKNLQKKNKDQMVSLANLSKHLKKQHQPYSNSSKKEKKREHVLIYSLRPTLLWH